MELRRDRTRSFVRAIPPVASCGTELQARHPSPELTARFPNPDGFIAGEIDVDTAAIPSMQHLDAQARHALTAAIREDMEAPLRAVTEDDQVVLPFHAHIVRAER